jgi:hypothetical protein
MTLTRTITIISVYFYVTKANLPHILYIVYYLTKKQDLGPHEQLCLSLCDVQWEAAIRNTLPVPPFRFQRGS